MKLQNWKLHEKLEALDGRTKLLKSHWNDETVYSDSISKFKVDDHYAVQDTKTSTTNIVNNYEAIIARLEERLGDAHSSLRDLKIEVDAKSNALFKVSFHSKNFFHVQDFNVAYFIHRLVKKITYSARKMKRYTRTT